MLPLLVLVASRCRAEIDWSKPFDKLDCTLPKRPDPWLCLASLSPYQRQQLLRYSQNMGSLDLPKWASMDPGAFAESADIDAGGLPPAGRTDNNYVRIDFGFLDYSFLSTAAQPSVRLGRVVNPYGLYNDTRDMPFTRPASCFRSPFISISPGIPRSPLNGVEVYGEQRTDYGDFLLQFNGGYARADDPHGTPCFGPGKSTASFPGWVD